MATLASLFVELGLKDNLSGGLDKVAKKARDLGADFRKVGLGMTAAFTAPALIGGKALLGVAEDFDTLQDTIRIGTGAVGADLKAMSDDALAVFKTIPTTMPLVGQAFSELSQRTDATGDDLAILAKTELELARITETDLGANIESTTKLFNSWGIATEDQVGTLDKLFRVTQATGVPVETLATQLTKYGPILREMGFGLDDSIALLGQLGKTGVDAGLVITGMRQAFAKFADEGVKDAGAELKNVFTRIRNAPSDLEAGRIAIDTFGARAGPALAENIRAGRLSYEDLLGVVENGTDTINGVAVATNDWRENLQILRNRIAVAVLPIANQLFAFLNEEGIPIATKIADRIETLANWFVALPRPIKIAIVVFGGLLTAVGPVLVVLGTLIPMISTVIAAFSAGGLFAAGGALAPLVGLLGPLALVLAAVVALGIAYKTNFLGIRDITNKVVGFVIRQFKRFVSFVSDVVHGGRRLHDAIEGLPEPLQKLAIAVRRVVVVFDDLLHGRWSEVAGDIERLGRTLGNLFQGLGLTHFGDEIKRTFRDIAQTFSDVVALVSDIVHGRWSEVWGDLGRLAVDGIRLFIDRFRLVGALIVDVFNLIPWTVVGEFLLNGVITAFNYLRNLDLGPILLPIGEAAMHWIWRGMVQFWAETVRPWLGDRIDAIIRPFETRARLLYDIGRNIVSWLWTGIASLWGWLTTQLGNIGAGIANVLYGGAFNGLFNAGINLMSGLYKGLLWGWDNYVKPTLEWINRQIPAWKGPPARDRTMLEPSGRLVMQGFTAGILAEVPKVYGALQGVTRGIAVAGAMPMPSLAVSASDTGGGWARGDATGGTTFAPGAIVVNVYEPKDGRQVAREFVDALDLELMGRRAR